jgi:hypothetical protein
MAGVTSLSLVIGQALPGTGLLVTLYDGDISTFDKRSFNIPRVGQRHFLYIPHTFQVFRRTLSLFKHVPIGNHPEEHRKRYREPL